MYISTSIGVIISGDQSDNNDIYRLTCSILVYIIFSGNMIAKDFRHSSDNTKIQLFKCVCSSYFCCQLWNNKHLFKSILNRAKSAYKRSTILMYVLQIIL